MEREKIVLIDGHSILNRAFFGLPLLSNSEGVHTNAILGFLNILFKVLDEEKAVKLLDIFLDTPFSEGENHKRRIEKIRMIEKG